MLIVGRKVERETIGWLCKAGNLRLRFDCVLLWVSRLSYGGQAAFRSTNTAHMNNNPNFSVGSMVRVKENYSLPEYRGCLGEIKKTIQFNKAYVEFPDRAYLLIDCDYLLSVADGSTTPLDKS